MLTMRDLFAGAGGSSTGAVAVPGVEVVHAMNHWQLAVDHGRKYIGIDLKVEYLDLSLRTRLRQAALDFNDGGAA